MKFKELFFIALSTFISIGCISNYAQSTNAEKTESWNSWIQRQKERYKQAAVRWIPTDLCFNRNESQLRDAHFGSIDFETQVTSDVLKALTCIVATPTGAVSGLAWQLLEDGYTASANILQKLKNKLITPEQAQEELQETFAKVKAEAEVLKDRENAL